jgi:hypothetical protein
MELFVFGNMHKYLYPLRYNIACWAFAPLTNHLTGTPQSSNFPSSHSRPGGTSDANMNDPNLLLTLSLQSVTMNLENIYGRHRSTKLRKNLLSSCSVISISRRLDGIEKNMKDFDLFII